MTSDIHRIDRLIIDPRYNGPNTSGNGGWVAEVQARSRQLWLTQRA